MSSFQDENALSTRDEAAQFGVEELVGYMMHKQLGNIRGRHRARFHLDPESTTVVKNSTVRRFLETGGDCDQVPQIHSTFLFTFHT